MDIGANVGSYTLLSSGICQARSISIEPSLAAIRLLRDNILLNNMHGRVTIINNAAGAVEDILIFSKNEDTTNHVLGKDESINALFEKVDVIPIDSLTVDDEPVLIKIDVEGYETEVLKGMKSTLKRKSLKGIIIELNGMGDRYGFSEEDIHQLLLANGFRPYLYNPFKRELCDTVSYGDFNTIYCRDMDFVNKRIKTGPKFKIMGENI
jgi:FkbM family methyltransferase